jgi:hypothetical protein
VYTTPAPLKIEVETFDGERRTVGGGFGNYSITILDPATIENKLNITAGNRIYNAGLGDDYWIP